MQPDAAMLAAQARLPPSCSATCFAHAITTCRYIQNKDDQKAGDEATLSEIQRFVSSKGFAKVELREEDIQMILDTLVYDGRLEQVGSRTRLVCTPCNVATA